MLQSRLHINWSYKSHVNLAILVKWNAMWLFFAVTGSIYMYIHVCGNQWMHMGCYGVYIVYVAISL